MELNVWNKAIAILLRNILSHFTYQEMDTLRFVRNALGYFPTWEIKLVFDAIIIHQHADIDISFLKMLQNLPLDNIPSHNATMGMLDKRCLNINIIFH